MARRLAAAGHGPCEWVRTETRFRAAGLRRGLKISMLRGDWRSACETVVFRLETTRGETSITPPISGGRRSGECDLCLDRLASVTGNLERRNRVFQREGLGDEGFDIDQALLHQADGHRKFLVKPERAFQ